MREIHDPEQLRRLLAAFGLQAYFSMPLADVATLVVFSPQETLIHRGRVSPRLYFLVKGRVRFLIDTFGGARLHFGDAKPGSPIGEVGSLWNRRPQVSAQATQECLCVAIDLAAHRERLLDDKVFLRWLCGRLSERIAALNLSMAGLARAPATVRVAACVLQNAPGGALALSLAECAEQAAVSYRHLIRVMNRLCEAGLLRKRQRRYEVANEKTLTAMAEGWMKSAEPMAT